MMSHDDGRIGRRPHCTQLCSCPIPQLCGHRNIATLETEKGGGRGEGRGVKREREGGKEGGREGGRKGNKDERS